MSDEKDVSAHMLAVLRLMLLTHHESAVWALGLCCNAVEAAGFAGAKLLMWCLMPLQSGTRCPACEVCVHSFLRWILELAVKVCNLPLQLCYSTELIAYHSLRASVCTNNAFGPHKRTCNCVARILTQRRLWHIQTMDLHISTLATLCTHSSWLPCTFTTQPNTWNALHDSVLLPAAHAIQHSPVAECGQGRRTATALVGTKHTSKVTASCGRHQTVASEMPARFRSIRQPPP